MNKYDCVFCGAATYDILLQVQHVPLSDQRIEALRKVESGGGPAATAAVAFQKLGLKASLVTGVGQDETGAKILKELKEYGVDIQETKIITGGSSSSSIIHVEKDSGKRAITYFGGCLQHLNPSEINMEIFKKTNLVHLDGNHFPLTYEVVKFIKTQTQAVISLDGGNIPTMQLYQILPFVDIFITDDKSTGKVIDNNNLIEACRLFYEKGPDIVVITQGEDGLIAYNGREYFNLSSCSVNVMDTTGAGDNFHGAFLYGYLKGWKLLYNLQFASAFAALTCRGLGGRSALPTLEETMRLVETTYNVK